MTTATRPAVFLAELLTTFANDPLAWPPEYLPKPAEPFRRFTKYSPRCATPRSHQYILLTEYIPARKGGDSKQQGLRVATSMGTSVDDPSTEWRI